MVAPVPKDQAAAIAKSATKLNKSANNNNLAELSKEVVSTKKGAQISPDDSPSIDQKNLSGWDSSQDENDGSPHQKRGKNLIGPSQLTNAKTKESPLVKQAEKGTADATPATKVENSIGDTKESKQLSEVVDSTKDKTETNRYSSPTTLTPEDSEGGSISVSENNSQAYYSSQSSSPDLSFFEPNTSERITGGIDYDMDEDEDWTEVPVALKGFTATPTDTDPVKGEDRPSYNKKQTEKSSSYVSKESLNLLNKFKAKQLSAKPLEQKKPPVPVKPSIECSKNSATEKYATTLSTNQQDDTNVQGSIDIPKPSSSRLDRTNSRIIVEENSPVSSLRDRFEKLAKASPEKPKSKVVVTKSLPAPIKASTLATSLQVPKGEIQEEPNKMQDVTSTSEHTEEFYPPPPILNDACNVRASVSSLDSDIPLPDDILQEMEDSTFQNDEASANSLGSFTLPPPSLPLEVISSNVSDGDTENQSSEDDNLLDNIVGQLKQLTNPTTELEEGDIPPPPPSCPPPDIEVPECDDDFTDPVVLPDPVHLPNDFPDSDDLPVYINLPDAPAGFPDSDEDDKDEETFLPPPVMDSSYEYSDDEAEIILPPPIESETKDSYKGVPTEDL